MYETVCLLSDKLNVQVLYTLTSCHVGIHIQPSGLIQFM
jgi:hypothetical protein